MAAKTASSLGAHLLRGWRVRLGITQTEAAQRLGLDLVQISKFERGTGRPGLRRAFRIEQHSGGEIPAASWLMPAPAEAADSPTGAAS